MSFRDIWPWPSHTKVQTLGLKKAFPLGFFIAFTPGMIVSRPTATQEEPPLSNGFYIQDTTTNSGEQMHLIFTEKG
jgi:hypothetical protein